MLLRDIFKIENTEVIVVDENSVVLGTSNRENRTILGQHNANPRVKRALLGSPDKAVLRDPKTGNRVRVLAVPIKISDGETIGAVYIEARWRKFMSRSKK